ncbi:bifunctional glutamate N-acetyltransferase/amino-acid acetyltransferase ArgJ [Candidatus Endowatersipora endosymbiont of Watersipora subatra]|uniref:bifunctional glutamate N-acetyltransferase/amino-acid acetyltransferase ArgJ n=1 Tax=Candidatus Endowatersipora endosymbiont of Watersipora subatra TaxID=3077946 RepID=UPI00312C9EAA
MNRSPSPLAPVSYPVLPPIKGVRIATMEAGIKYSGRHDLMLMVFDKPANVAGVFTKSRCPSAPVTWCRFHLAGSINPKAKALVINSGNANAFTGRKGNESVLSTASAAAEVCNCSPSEVYLASTGVIGEPLDTSSFPEYLKILEKQAIEDNWYSASKTIMTTDTYPKLASIFFDIDHIPVYINGIAKGSGMIEPNMATMLAFIVTDLPVTSSVLQKLLQDLTHKTFNAVTVDGDTSTSDTLMLFSIEKRNHSCIKDLSDSRLSIFQMMLHSVLHDLAMQIVRDGEGATKHVEVHVRGAKSSLSAKKIAKTIANSPLVKTAIAGEDANWGRVVMAVGKSGEFVERDRLNIWFGDIQVTLNGARHPDYSEEAAGTVMKEEYIRLTVDLGIGNGKSTVWTCDFTQEYIQINSNYRS